MTEYIRKINNIRNSGAKLSLSYDLLLCVCTVVFGALMGLGTFGVLFAGISGAAFAFQVLTSKRPFKWLSPILSFALAFLMSENVLVALTSLAFIPVAAVLIYCAVYNKNITAATVAATVVLFIVLGLSFAIELTNVYGLSLSESIKAFGADVQGILRDVLDYLKYMGEDGQFYSYSDDVIEEYTELICMAILPSAVILCEFLAYFTASAVIFFSKSTAFPLEYAKGSRLPYLSFAASVVFTLSYIVSFFAYSSPVISYATLYIIVIIMPFAAVEGVKRVFGKNGIFRKGAKSTRIIFIITGAMTLILSPVAIGPLLAVIGGIGVLGDGIAQYLKSRGEK